MKQNKEKELLKKITSYKDQHDYLRILFNLLDIHDNASPYMRHKSEAFNLSKDTNILELINIYNELNMDQIIEEVDKFNPNTEKINYLTTVLSNLKSMQLNNTYI